MGMGAGGRWTPAGLPGGSVLGTGEGEGAGFGEGDGEGEGGGEGEGHLMLGRIVGLGLGVGAGQHLPLMQEEAPQYLLPVPQVPCRQVGHGDQGVECGGTCQWEAPSIVLQ